MQAITVKYMGPTTHRGARMRASCEAGSIIVPWDYAQNPERNAVAACEALLAKLRWDGTYFGGLLPSGAWAFCTDAGDAWAQGVKP